VEVAETLRGGSSPPLGFRVMCPQGCGGSSPPFGTRNRQAGVLLSLLGQRSLKREYFGSIAAPSSVGSVAVSFTSTLNIR